MEQNKITVWEKMGDHPKVWADYDSSCGRCGRYTYIDMSPCVHSTLTYIRKFLAGEELPEE